MTKELKTLIKQLNKWVQYFKEGKCTDSEYISHTNQIIEKHYKRNKSLELNQ